MKRLSAVAVFAFLLLVLAGPAAAADEYFVRVNAKTLPGLDFKEGYVILPLDERVNINDPQFHVAVSRVKKMLEKRGMVETDIKNAKTAVLISPGISGPHRALDPEPGKSKQPQSYTMAFTGEERPNIYYTCWLLLKGVRVKQENSTRTVGESLWHVNAFCSGSKDRLEAVMPALLLAIEKHFGTTTKKGFAFEKLAGGE